MNRLAGSTPQPNVPNGRAAGERVFEIMDSPIEEGVDAPLDSFDPLGFIEFRDVSFPTNRVGRYFENLFNCFAWPNDRIGWSDRRW